MSTTGRFHRLVFVTCLLVFASSGTAAEPLRVAVISDLNGSYGSTEYATSVDRAVDRILALQPDLVISAGDMVAGQRIPHLEAGEIDAMWRAFHAHVSDRILAAGIPLAVTPGNHDASAYRGFEAERRIYGDQWRGRKPDLAFVDDTGYPYYYAFAAGEVLFLALDVTTTGKLPAAQKDWLASLLAEHGPQYRHRIVFSHVPLWPFARGRETEFSGDAELEELLHDADVGLYLSGHHQAFYPGSKDGIHFVSMACVGSGPRVLIGDSERSERSIALIEIDGPALRIAALRSPDFSRAIDWRELPEKIETKAAVLSRADLVENPLGQLDPARYAETSP